MSSGASPPPPGGGPRRLLAAVVAGLITGVVTVALVTSLALLIFSGALAPSLVSGVGLLLVGTLLATLINGLLSSYPGAVAINHDVPAAVLATVAGGIAASLGTDAPHGAVHATVVAAIVATSLLTGVVFLVLGWLRLGALFRFLPYPVVGGFIAGTGWLLASGGLGAMAGVPLAWGDVAALFDAGVWQRWAPGAAFAVVLMLVLDRSNHYLIIAGMIAAAAGAFYLVVSLLGVPLEQLRADGWLLGPFPEDSLWQPLSTGLLSSVHWPALAEQSGSIGAIVIVSTLALLLNSSGLELIVERDFDLDRELRAAGLGSAVSGLAGGLVSYPALSLTTLGYRIGGSHRVIPLIVALVIGAALYLGPAILSWTPQMIFGGLLMFLGLTVLKQWIYRAWFRFPLSEFTIILSILLVIAGVGFLEGMILGVALAVARFVLSYSRVDIVRHAFAGNRYRSRVVRGDAQTALLDRQARAVHVLQLQGFIFFGTANTLLQRVRERMADREAPALRFLVMDFRYVTGLDSTAMLSFIRMKQLARERQVMLVFCEMAPGRTDRGLGRFFERLSEDDPYRAGELLRELPDLDHALEWCENQLLESGEGDHGRHELLEYLRSALPAEVPARSLLTYFERLEVPAGYYLMREDDPPEDLYFIESGQATVRLESADGQSTRLETMRGGRMVGEIGFFTGRDRSAAVVTDEASTLYRLSRHTLQDMEHNDPRAARALYLGIIRLLSDRVLRLNDALQALRV